MLCFDRQALYEAETARMPSVLQQHGFGKGRRTVRIEGTSDSNPDLVVRLHVAQASIAALGRDRSSILVSSRASGMPLLLRPRDTLTLYIGDRQLVMSVLGIYPLPDLCRRTGLFDKAVLLVAVA
jgi:hypothetical protein